MVNKLNWRQQSRLGPWWLLLGTASDEALVCDLSTALAAPQAELREQLWLGKDEFLSCCRSVEHRQGCFLGCWQITERAFHNPVLPRCQQGEVKEFKVDN